eukprot:TRINITY_DN13472_c0_g1_i2.p1 TRINITY_DN13472_c0_g1~~TRINITY_DN13472_c0_g1_i2.p1  ORF type:complete len:771 (-),score=183.82 TRINITY_DN13472_c0_g1_i2:130-2442(-)
MAAPESAVEDKLASVEVSLYGLAGKLLQFVSDPSSSVRELKLRISERLQVPPLCQRLVIGTHLLEDEELLVAYCSPEGGSAALIITMISTLGGVIAGASDERASTRRQAVETMVHVAQVDYERAVEILVVACADTDQQVRLTALRVLGFVARFGDRLAQEAFRRRLSANEYFERRLALEGFAQTTAASAERAGLQGGRVTTPPPATATTLPEPCMIDGFAELAKVDAGLGLAALAACLEHDVAEVAWGAASLLISMADKGALPVVVEEVRSCVERASGRAKLPAMKVLSRLASRNEQAAVDTLAGCLDSWEADVRKAAVDSLGLLVTGNDAWNLQVIARRLEHPYEWTRRAAAEALEKVVGRDDVDVAVSIVGRRLEHADECIRRSAFEALRRLTSKSGDDRLLQAVAARLEHAEESVRRSAARFLAELTPQSGRRRPASASGSRAQSTSSANWNGASGDFLRQSPAASWRAAASPDVSQMPATAEGKHKAADSASAAPEAASVATDTLKPTPPSNAVPPSAACCSASASLVLRQVNGTKGVKVFAVAGSDSGRPRARARFHSSRQREELLAALEQKRSKSTSDPDSLASTPRHAQARLSPPSAAEPPPPREADRPVAAAGRSDARFMRLLPERLRSHVSSPTVTATTASGSSCAAPTAASVSPAAAPTQHVRSILSRSPAPSHAAADAAAPAGDGRGRGAALLSSSRAAAPVQRLSPHQRTPQPLPPHRLARPVQLSYSQAFGAASSSTAAAATQQPRPRGWRMGPSAF